MTNLCELNDEKIQERLLSEYMLLEEVFKMAQAMELATANEANIKNTDKEVLHKMGTKNRVQLRYKRRKGCVLGAVKNSTRDVYSVQQGEKLF